MWPLRNRGVRLAIDDFGTGHSNFASITRLPFDVFKIDQQFVRALDTDPHAPAIVEMILAMAEALGQETVAEGVETQRAGRLPAAPRLHDRAGLLLLAAASGRRVRCSSSAPGVRARPTGSRPS